MVDSWEESLTAWDREHVWHPLTQHATASPLLLTHGEGALVYGADGRAYLDASAGLWCVAVGHGRRELTDAAARQMNALAFYPLTQSHPPAILLARRLAEHLPDNPRVYFTNSGSEANEVAFKVIRQYWTDRGEPQRTVIIGRDRAYHGSTLATLAASGQPERRRGYGPLPADFRHAAAPYCYRCPFGLTYPACAFHCAETFRQIIEEEGPERVAAIIVEPIGAGGGVLVPPPGYLQAVSAIAQAYGVKLIVDEVVTGFGRTGAMFRHRAEGVTADVVTMAKGLASGYMPIGAAAFNEDLFQAFSGPTDSGRHFRHVNTFGGHPVATAVALENLDILDREQLVERSRLVGAELLATLRDRLAPFSRIGDIRGQGLFIGIEIVDDPPRHVPASDEIMRRLVREMAAAGVLVGKTTDVVARANNVLIVAPPLVITDRQMTWLVDALHRSIETLSPHPVA